MRGPGDLAGTRQSGYVLPGLLTGGGTLLLDEVVRAVREMETDPALEKEWSRIRWLADAYLKENHLRVAKN